MAETYKTFQLAPAATTLTPLYTVPALTETVCSTLNVCNRSASGTSYRWSIAIAGAADSDEQYMGYDVALGSNAVHAWTIGPTLAAGTVIRVYVNDATVSFNLFGAERT